jgi:hypothetical protein
MLLDVRAQERGRLSSVHRHQLLLRVSARRAFRHPMLSSQVFAAATSGGP